LVVSEDQIACVTVLHGSAVGVERTFQHFQQLYQTIQLAA